MSETNKTIVTVGLMIGVTANMLMFGREATRRSTDDLVKIVNARKEVVNLSETERKATECIDAGRLPQYGHNGDFRRCNRN